MLMRTRSITFFALVAMALAAFDPAAAVGVGGVSKADRPGSDYRNFEVPPLTGPHFGDEADLCQSTCASETGCKAWAYVDPGVQGAHGRCWLKNSVPAAVPCTYCTSGVKIGDETNIDRPGGDIRNFATGAGQLSACQAACDEDNRCTTWTYVRPGVQGPAARCWLKNSYPPAVVNDCCTTGMSHRPSPPLK
jgi:hypothetical protein